MSLMPIQSDGEIFHDGHIIVKQHYYIDFKFNFFAERDHEKERAAFISQYFSTGPGLNERKQLFAHSYEA